MNKFFKGISFFNIAMMLGVITLAAPASALTVQQAAEQFKPIYKFRNDHVCWPSKPAGGANSGVCTSKNDFNNNKNSTYIYHEGVRYNVRGKEHFLINYWLYYGHQDQCSSLGIGEHVDDWEATTVHVVDGRVEHVTYWQHDGRYTFNRYDSDLTLINGKNPEVLVGKYSHGGYHDKQDNIGINKVSYATGRYCQYFADPRSPNDVHWTPTVRPLSEVGHRSVFPGSENPLTRDAFFMNSVCKNQAGKRVLPPFIDYVNTCDVSSSGADNENTRLLDLINNF